MSYSKEQILKQLQKILQSNSCKKSKINCELLEYLVKESISGHVPKETEIGIDVFNKKYDKTDSLNSNIRVYIYNLRKKLNSYYNSEGKNDKIIFEIEKGHYHVIFHHREKEVNEKTEDRSKYKLYKLLFFATLLVLVLGSVANIIFTKPHKSKYKNYPMWSDFHNSPKKTLLVLGDHFLMNSSLPTNNEGLIRDYYVNSRKEYEEFMENNPELEDSLSASYVTYLTKQGPFSMKMINDVFYDMNTDFQLKLASEIQMNDLKNYNIIFIGSYKTIEPFKDFLDFDFDYNIIENQHEYLVSTGNKADTFRIEGGWDEKTDYSLLLNFQSLSGNSFLFFLSSQDIGNISTVRLFTNGEYLEKFYKEQVQPLNTKYFKALYRVKGFNTTDFTYELLRVDKIETDS